MDIIVAWHDEEADITYYGEDWPYDKALLIKDVETVDGTHVFIKYRELPPDGRIE